MLRCYCWILFLVLCLSSCTTEQASPEEVVRQYASLVNQGQLDEAKRYCTPAGAAYLDALYAIMTASETAVDTFPVAIQTIQCSSLSDSIVYCQTQENDGYETYEAKYHLQLTADGWQIDQPPVQGETSTSEEVIDPNEEKN